jgi:hypothetical protein
MKKYTTVTFIEKAKQVHGDLYDYSLVNYIKSNINVIIKCKTHGGFNQIPATHLRGHGCFKCNNRGNPRLTTEQFIEKSKKVHGIRYDYSDTNYITALVKVKILCKKCNKIFIQSPYNHLAGNGCTYCRMSKGELTIEKYLNENNIEYEKQKTFPDCLGKKNKKLRFDFYLVKQNVCIEFDGSQHNDDSKSWNKKYSSDVVKNVMRRDAIKTEYCKSNNVPLIRIPAFQMNEINKILDDYFINGKIPNATVLFNVNNLTLAKSDFIERAKVKHNNKYTYEKVNLISMFGDVIITCPVHGDFIQVPHNHLQGSNCPKCARESATTYTRLPVEKFIERAKEIHGGLYDYSKVLYKNEATDVIIICPIHRGFSQMPIVHIRQKSGCPECSKIRVSYKLADIHKMGADEFIKRAKEIHGSLYDYSKVIYKNVATPVILICPIHGEFMIRPGKHLYRKQGCKLCR